MVAHRITSREVLCEALAVYATLGLGDMVLWVNDDDNSVAILKARPDKYENDPVSGILKNLEQRPVSKECVELLLWSGALHKLTEVGEPPPEMHKRGGGYRLGWREMGFLPYDTKGASAWVQK